MRRIFFIVCLFSFFQVIYAQENENYDNRLYSYTIKNIYFYKYVPDFQIKAIKNISDVKTEFPEQLAQSILSCSSEQWEIFNTLGGKNNANIRDIAYYNKVSNMNIDKNYFILKHKIEFEIDAVPTAIIKFYLITENFSQPQAGVIVLQKYNNKWYKTSMNTVSNLALTILRLKTEELEKIIIGNTETTELKEIHQKIYINGILDFNKLSQEVESWYYEDTKQNKAKLQYFKDPYSIL